MQLLKDETAKVAVQDIIEDEQRKDASTTSEFRGRDRIVCPNCRMLLSVIETRIGECRSCHTEVKPDAN